MVTGVSEGLKNFETRGWIPCNNFKDQTCLAAGKSHPEVEAPEQY